MHALIINGSPRVKKYSNTDKILEKIISGMKDSGSTGELYEISDRKQWEEIREKFYHFDHILIALPLFVECIPGLLLEFLETLPVPAKDEFAGERKVTEGSETDSAFSKKPVLSFLLQSGFAEGCQLRCGEEYLSILSGKLGCEYGGTLVKGNNFGRRLVEEKDREKMVLPYQRMGQIYGEEGNFFSEECKKFTGPEQFPGWVRVMVGLMFKTFAKKSFDKAAKEWGCTKSLKDRPYET